MLKKVLVINEGESVNLGDKAIHQVLAKKIEGFGSEVIFGSYSQPSIKGVSSSEVTYSEQSMLKKIIVKLFFLINKLTFNCLAYSVWIIRNGSKVKQVVSEEGIELGVIGGGQLLMANGSFPISAYFWTKQLSKNKVPFVFYGVGVKKEMGFLSKFMIKKSVNRAEKVFVREEYSKKVLLEITKETKVEVVPDVAFAYSDIEIERKAKNRLLVMPASYEYVYQQYNSGMTLQEYILDWVNQTLELYNKGEYEEIVVSYSTISQDKKDALIVYEELMKHDVKVVFCDVNSLADFEKVINESKATYSGRMHPLILGMSFSRAVYVYELSKKMEVFNALIVSNKEFCIKKVKDLISSSLKKILLNE